MRRSTISLAGVLAISFVFAVPITTTAAASSHAASGQNRGVGKVNFPTSCSAEAQGSLEKGLALLHSFQYEESAQAFSEAAQRDGQCAMAYWGKAMSLDHQLWDFPTAATLAEGRKDIEQAQKLGQQTAREREYIAAAFAFYQDDPKLTHTARVQAYSTAMQKLYADNPQDVEAGAFYALSLVALAQGGVDELPNRRKAIAILNPLFERQPNNPGLAHYLIHACDAPELASEGLPAARLYAKIAPDSSHATHMPSHIFRQLGLWQEMIDSNIAAMAVAAEATEQHRGDASYEFHAMDFLNYAYLQAGEESKARQLIEEAKSVPGAKPEDLADHQATFAAVNAIELHRWKEASSLAIPKERLTWQDVTYWARAIGAARSGDVNGARENAQKLAEILQAQAAHQKELGNQVPAQRVEQREVDGWVANAEGKSDEALADLRGAAEFEESDREDPVCVPAREMLADLLLELKRPKESLVEYQAVLKNYPNRFDAIYGAARASEAAASRQQARDYYNQLVKISLPGADRPELRAARDYVAANGN